MSDTTTILTIEAATRARSVALFKKGVFQGEQFEYQPKQSHSERLLTMLDRLLNASHLTLADLDLIAVTAGPGSFTSVRIGLATAQGLAFVHKTPLVALDSLRVLASQPESENAAVMPMLDARKGEVYAALYPENPQPQSEPLLAGATDSAENWLTRALKATDGPLLLCGDGAAAYQQHLAEIGGERVHFALDESVRYPRAAALGRLVMARQALGLPCLPAHPLYLRKPEAVVNLEKG
jgi:tRNA threonylcarbamoyladenosine biosynthesis protein TsaB